MNIDPQLMQQRFASESFLKRVEVSEYKTDIILKGGYLIGTMIGIGNRMTRDLDATLQDGYDEKKLNEIINKVAKINLHDGVKFSGVKVKQNKKIGQRNKPGFEAHMKLMLENPDPSKRNKPVIFPLKMDLTTNESIIPSPKRYSHKSVIDGSKIDVYAYPVEQILAEKMSACLNHGDEGTRSRDFFDIYALKTFEKEKINKKLLRASIINEFENNGQNDALINPISAFDDLRNSRVINQQWERQKKQFVSNKVNLKLGTTIDVATDLLNDAGFKRSDPQPQHRPWLSKERHQLNAGLSSGIKHIGLNQHQGPFR